MFGFFKKDHSKNGRDTGEAVIKIIDFCMWSVDPSAPNKKLPPDAFEDLYIYGFFSALGYLIMNFGFGGRGCSMQEKGQFNIAYTKVLDDHFGSNMLEMANSMSVSTERELEVTKASQFIAGRDAGGMYAALMYKKLHYSITSPELEKARNMASTTKIDLPSAMAICSIVPAISAFLDKKQTENSK